MRSLPSRVLILLALIVSLLLPAFHPPAASAAVPPGYTPRGPGDVYLALGDSLTTGTEVAGNADGLPGYPDSLYTQLKAISPNLAYTRLGRDSETSTSLIDDAKEGPSQLEQAESFIAAERAAGRRIGLVTLSIGGNDIASILPAPVGEGRVPTDTLGTFRSSLTIILDRLLAAMTVNGVRQGDIVVMDYYNPYPGFSLPPLLPEPLADIWIPQFNATIKELAAQRGLAVAEVAQAFVGREAELIYVRRGPNGEYPALFPIDTQRILTEFDFHPRPAGHTVIVEEFRRVLGYSQPQATRLAIILAA